MKTLGAVLCGIQKYFQIKTGTVSNTAERPVVHGYKFSYIAVHIKFRNTLLTTERLVAASEGRMSDIAFKAIHEQEE